MFENRLIKSAFFLNILIQNSAHFLTDPQKNIIEDLNKKLYIKHLSIIKDTDFHVDCKILLFVKELSSEKIYTSALTVTQMNYSMHEYYYISDKNYHYDFNYHEHWNLIDEKRINPPKTMVILYGENLKEIINQLFTRPNELVVSTYIWLISGDFHESFIDPEFNYVPYNCQLLVVQESTNKVDEYLIDEYYNPTISGANTLNRLFGVWGKNKGLIIFERDFYQRRLDTNGTIFIVSYPEDKQSLMKDWQNSIRMECQILQEISRMMNLNLLLLRSDDEIDTPWEVHAVFFLWDYILFDPFFIGPLIKEDVSMYIAYDEKYEQHEISPFLRPFSFRLWMAVVSYTVIAIFSTAIIHHVYNKANKSKSRHSILFFDYLFEPIELFLNQSGQVPPNKSPFLIASIATRLTALFIVPAYTGAILSFILTPTLKLPFKDIKGFVEDGSYQLGYPHGAIPFHVYFKWTNNEHLKIAFEKSSQPITGFYLDAVVEGMNRMCNDHSFAFMSYTLDLEQAPCKIFKIHSPLFIGWASLQLRHGSPYTEIFNRFVKTLFSNGVIIKMRKDDDVATEAEGNVTSRNSKLQDKAVTVKITNLLSIFMTTGVLYAISVITFTAEIVINKIKQRNKRNQVKSIFQSD